MAGPKQGPIIRGATSLAAGHAAAMREERGLLTSAPVSAFGFLIDASGSRSQPMLTHRSSLPHEPARTDRALRSSQPPPPPGPNSVVLDSSLGQTRQPVVSTNSNGQNDYAIYGTMGLQIGGNLFFSFSAFNLATHESATFSGPFASPSTAIENILARVTGGASSIDGLISTYKIPGANFFLLNPAGVIFGPNAELDLGGSFVVSTADYLTLAGGAKFDALPNASDESLTAAPAAAFGFTHSAPSGVQLNGSQLSVSSDTGFDVIAGAITLSSGAALSAPSGALSMFSASSAGAVPFDLAKPAAGFAAASAKAGGAITMSQQSTAAIDGNGGGKVAVYGGVVALASSTLSSNNRGSAVGGSIVVHAQTLILTDGARISSTANNAGNSGSVLINADDVTVTGASGALYSSIRSLASGGSGNAGTLVIHTGDLSLTNGGEINGGSLSAGRGATIVVTAETLTIAGTTALSMPGIYSVAHSTGAAGVVDVDVAGALTMIEGGRISSSTDTAAQGGSVNVEAGQLTILGGSPGSILSSGIFAASNSIKQGGAAGNVTVNVSGPLTLAGGGRISSSTDGLGQGGNIEVDAGQVTIAGGLRGVLLSSGIFAVSDSLGAGGAAGEVIVNTPGLLSLTGGGRISSSTSGLGQGGSIGINAGELMISGRLPGESLASGILANTIPPGLGGSAGEIVVNVAGLLMISGSGTISTSTDGLGQGGSIQIEAGELTVTGGLAGTSFSSGIFANANSPGPGGSAGNVTVDVAGLLTLAAGGDISSSTYGLGGGGSIQIEARRIIISGGLAGTKFSSGLFANSYSSGPSGSAGEVTVHDAGLLEITDGGKISSVTRGLGQGGSVQIKAAEISVSGSAPNIGSSTISASSKSADAGGAAGDVRIEARTLMLDDAAVISSLSNGSGDAGAVEITAGQVTLSDASTISTSAPRSDAGSISIRAGSNIELSGGSTIAASAGDNGGNITLTAGNLAYLLDSSITATAGTLKGAAAGGGTGGNITIDPVFIILDHSLISANAAIGQGGNILLETENYLSSESQLTATGSTAGTITIAAPELDLTNGLAPLSGSLLDVAAQLREQCASRLGQDFSSFLVLGQGGVDAAPDQAQADRSEDQNRRNNGAADGSKKAAHPSANRQ